MAKILFVAFHGLVCLVDGGKKAGVDRGFKAYVLRDQDNVHRQMFGNFLAEQDFSPAPGGSLPVKFKFSDELQSGNGTLNPDLDAVVKLTDFPVATPSNTVAVFTLPRPNTIDYNLGGTITAGMLVDPPPEHLIRPPRQISQLRFFEYKFTDVKKVFLSDEQGNVVWNCPPLVTVGGDDIAVFHVYDEPPKTLESQASIDAHNVREFKDSMNFLLGASNNVRIKSPAKIDPGTFTPPHRWILPEEIAALDLRQKNFLEFIRQRRSGAHAATGLGGAGGSQVCGGANGTV